MKDSKERAGTDAPLFLDPEASDDVYQLALGMPLMAYLAHRLTHEVRLDKEAQAIFGAVEGVLTACGVLVETVNHRNGNCVGDELSDLAQHEKETGAVSDA